ncbi:MAG: hypothetical protein Q9227_000691 [Pyrenula ochraceoflavens]
MGTTFSQFFPPAPTLTEANLPSQKGKVFIVTGGASGVGLELCTLLYHAGGKVYLAGRSEPNAQAAISRIKSQRPSSSSSSSTNQDPHPGSITFLPLSLDDLTTIKPAVTTFTTLESRLDILFNNAGVSLPPRGSLSAQGHELQIATNCLGPYLFTQLLLPTLLRTAETSPSGSVRVIWTSSIAVDATAPPGGLIMSELHPNNLPSSQQRNYLNSKTGNWFLAARLAQQAGKRKRKRKRKRPNVNGRSGRGVLSLTQNPGNLKTNLLRHSPWLLGFLTSPLLYQAKMGAYTNLYAGLSEDLNLDEHGGAYVVPWGRLHPGPRRDLTEALKDGGEGGTGRAREFEEWCEVRVRGFR